MPGGDRTGPLGMGPMTGRGAGYCAGYSVPGYMNPYGGRGMAFRRGRFGGRGWFGRGRGYGWFYPPMAAPFPSIVLQPWLDTVPYNVDEELETLRSQAQALEASLSGIQKRIEELESKGSDKKAE